MTRAVQPTHQHPTARLSLTSEFQLLIGERNVAVPHGVQRVLAFLAIADRPTPRSRVAGQLWLDAPEWRALGNLRSALWRLRRIRRAIVNSMDERLSLDPGVRVDVGELTEVSSRLLEDSGRVPLTELRRLVTATEILPGWEEEWLIVERERFRELRLRALERACETLTAEGDHGRAVQACLAAVEAEPFRESAQRLLVRMHLAEGNRAAALRSYLAYSRLVEDELGIQPSALMKELVADLEPQVSLSGATS